ncbi:hypothetical protein NQ315_013665 [Exocentrus adspersus]|uniref:Uncharacterized protein n=1 Tax=Exocentrus adspersus TaxID=1586481 RepID=A0AAV8W3V9_9CUCU|nr:hypothetical protein NQ315_013665 [Exocentrus adspersus]
MSTLSKIKKNEYIDKFKLFLEAVNTKKNFEESCSDLLVIKEKAEVLYSKIRKAKEVNRVIQNMISDKRQIIELNNRKLSEMREKNKRREEHLPDYGQIEILKKDVIVRKVGMEDHYKLTARNQHEIRKRTRLVIQQLFKYIFPIMEIMPEEEIESDFVMICNVSKTRESTHLSREQWQFIDYSSEKQYRIVAPTLPSSGDYSAYNYWVAKSRDSSLAGSILSDTLSHTPAVTISAALAYTIQLVQVLSFYLNERLPHYIDHSSFTPHKARNYTAKPFRKRVNRLNVNILSLCLSQNVDPRYLRQHQTVHNILQLVRSVTRGLQLRAEHS